LSVNGRDCRDFEKSAERGENADKKRTPDELKNNPETVFVLPRSALLRITGLSAQYRRKRT
jgi:hypothetical protein